MDKWEKEYNKMAELNEFFGLPYDEHTDELIKSFIRTIRQNDKIQTKQFCIQLIKDRYKLI